MGDFIQPFIRLGDILIQVSKISRSYWFRTNHGPTAGELNYKIFFSSSAEAGFLLLDEEDGSEFIRQMERIAKDGFIKVYSKVEQKKPQPETKE